VYSIIRPTYLFELSDVIRVVEITYFLVIGAILGFIENSLVFKRICDTIGLIVFFVDLTNDFSHRIIISLKDIVRILYLVILEFLEDCVICAGTHHL